MDGASNLLVVRPKRRRERRRRQQRILGTVVAFLNGLLGRASHRPNWPESCAHGSPPADPLTFHSEAMF